MGSKFWRKIFFQDLKSKNHSKSGGSHFCNKPFGKYGIKHKVATPYELQIGGQVKLSSREIKNNLMKVVNTNLYAGA